MARAEKRLNELGQLETELNDKVIDPAEATAALARFDPVWQVLSPREQADLVSLLVSRVSYDGSRETAAVTLHPAGIATLNRFDDLNEATR